MSDLYGDNTDADTLQGAGDAEQQLADTTQNQAQEYSVPAPSIQGRKVVKKNSDGSYELEGGAMYNPGTQTLQWDQGGLRFTNARGMPKTITRPLPRPTQRTDDAGKLWERDMTSGKWSDVTPEGFSPKLDPAISKNLVDRGISPYDEGGKMISPKDAMSKIMDFDKSTGKLSAAQQHEVDKVTQQANSSRSMYAKQYITMQPNYASVLENVESKPMDQRNGVDDAYLISAAAGLENPGRSTTEEDFRLLLKTQGYRGNLETMSERITNAIKGGDDASLRGTRILSDAQVKQILDNSYRAIKPRHEEYLSGQRPYLERLRRVGVTPEDYVPNLDLPTPKSKQSQSLQPQSTPISQYTPQQHSDTINLAKTTLSDPSASQAAKAQAQRVLSLTQPSPSAGQPDQQPASP